MMHLVTPDALSTDTGFRPAAAAADSLEEQLSSLGADLARAGNALIAESLDGVRSPAAVAATLGVNKDLSSKFLIALAKSDPIALVHFCPGPEALQKLAARARVRGVGEPTVTAFERAIASLEATLDRLGGKSALDALVSAWVPEARERIEQGTRQTAWRSLAAIKGNTARITVGAAFLHPSVQTPGRIDVLIISGHAGYRRLRPGAPLRFVIEHSAGAEPSVLTIDGQPIDADTGSPLLRDFCSTPPPEFRISQRGRALEYEVLGERIGLDAAVDAYFGQYSVGAMSDRASEPGRRTGTGVGIATPCQTLIFDVLVHTSLWPDDDPELLVYDTALRGVPNPNDRSRDRDRLKTAERFESLGRGLAGCRVSSLDHHVDLLRHVCRRRQWDERAFRVYRCQATHPLYGSYYTAAFPQHV